MDKNKEESIKILAFNNLGINSSDVESCHVEQTSTNSYDVSIKLKGKTENKDFTVLYKEPVFRIACCLPTKEQVKKMQIKYGDKTYKLNEGVEPRISIGGKYKKNIREVVVKTKTDNFDDFLKSIINDPRILSVEDLGGQMALVAFEEEKQAGDK